jgi:hypothetical protein
MYYHCHKQQAEDPYPPEAAPNNTDGAQTIKNQTIFVGGVYHQRYKPPPDTTTTNLPLKGLAIDV